MENAKFVSKDQNWSSASRKEKKNRKKKKKEETVPDLTVKHSSTSHGCPSAVSTAAAPAAAAGQWGTAEQKTTGHSCQGLS